MTIHLACCSDTHDGLPPVLDVADVSAWLHAGDIYEGTTRAKAAGTPRFRRQDWTEGEALRRWTAEQVVPVYAVRGNHDCKDCWKVFDAWQDVSGRIVQLAERLFVAGIGWHGEKYFDTPGESDVRPVCEMILRQARRLVTPRDSLVLLTHYPPLLPGMFPTSGGVDAFVCIRQLIEQLTPVTVVQGHVHAWFGLSGYWEHAAGKTLVLSPGPPGAILSVDVESRSAICRMKIDER